VEGLPSEAVIAEAEKGYDLVVLGAEHLAAHAKPPRSNGGGTGRFSVERLRQLLRLENESSEASGSRSGEDEPPPAGPLFDEFVDRVIKGAPCPVLILSADAGSLDWADDPDALDHVLLPVWGSASDQFGAEIAFSIAKGRDATVHVMHAHPKTSRRRAGGGELDTAHIGEELVRRIAEIGDWVGATVETEVVVADHPEQAIVERAKRDIDLIVLETARSPVTQRAFLGHHVDHVLHHAPCAVALIVFKGGVGQALAAAGSQGH
jgi:nucleotide-binding universal stress UspA family protein